MINSTNSFTSILCRMIIIVQSCRSLSFCVSVYEFLLDENEHSKKRAKPQRERPTTMQIKHERTRFETTIRLFCLNRVNSVLFWYTWIVSTYVDFWLFASIARIRVTATNEFVPTTMAYMASRTNTIFAQAVRCVYTFHTCVNKAIYRS